jgi:hypothetical protein
VYFKILKAFFDICFLINFDKNLVVNESTIKASVNEIRISFDQIKNSIIPIDKNIKILF